MGATEHEHYYKPKVSISWDNHEKGPQHLMVKTNAAIYIRKSSDDGTSSSDGQLRELDGIGDAMSLSQIRRTPKFVDNGGAKKNAAPEVGIPLGMLALWENRT